MKKIFFLIGLVLIGLSFSIVGVQAQCWNLNFSMANTTNWQAYAGTCSGGNININPSPAISGRHTIINASLLIMTGLMQDEHCMSIPKVPTGFNYSLKLGNDATGAEVDGIEYTMTVDSTNSLLILHFAWVMEVPSHDSTKQPRFTMTIKDSSGNAITNTCGEVNFIASQDLSNLVCKTDSLVARNWTTVGFSLEHLIGQTIKIYFETRDCTEGDHFGYAYIVGECRPMTIELMYSRGQSALRIRAPEGFIWYKWTRSSDTSWLIEGSGRQFHNIIYDPVDREVFTCEVTSELGPNCSATLHTIIVKTIIDVDFAFGVMENGNVDIVGHDTVDWYDTCNRTVTFVDLSTVKNSKKESILWEIPALGVISYDSLFTYTFPDPETNEPVEYRVRLTVSAENGCIDTSSRNITIYPSPKVEIDGNNRLCEGDTLYLKAASIRSEFANHTWSWIDTNNIPQTASGDSIQIDNFGTYTLVSENIFGCFSRDSLTVTIPKPMLNNLSVTDVNCYGEATGRFIHGALSGGKSPYISFTWTLPDKDGNDSIVEANPYYAIFFNLKAGIYRFNAIDVEGCTLSGEIEIKQNDSLRITAIPYSATLGSDNGRLKLAATGGVSPYKFKIEKEDGTHVISSDTASKLSAGVYTITVIDAVDCITSDTISITALDSVIVSDTVSLVIMNTHSSIIVYPNPANTKLYVKLGFQEMTNYAVYNMMGQMMMQGKLQEEITIIDIGFLANGMYYLKITDRRNTAMKIIKNIVVR